MATGLLTGAAFADEAGVDSLLKKWDQSVQEWTAGYEIASPEMRRELAKTQPNPDQLAKALWVQLKPVVNSPRCLPGIIWILDNAPAVARTHDPETCKQIIDKVLGSLNNDDMILTPGVGKAAHALGLSSDLRCRQILEKIRQMNPDPKDQGMAALGLAMSVKERHGMLRDDPRINNVRLTYIKEAIQKSFDEPFGKARVRDFCQEFLYEINNLSINRKAPAFQLKMSDGQTASVPSGKPTLLVFCMPNDKISMSFAIDAHTLKDRFSGLEVLTICPMNGEQAAKVLPVLDMPGPVALDDKSATFGLYRIPAVPFTYLVDAGGAIRMRGIPDSLFATMLENALTDTDRAQAASGQEPADRAAPVAAPASRPETPPEQGLDGLSAPALRPLPE